MCIVCVVVPRQVRAWDCEAFLVFCCLEGGTGKGGRGRVGGVAWEPEIDAWHGCRQSWERRHACSLHWAPGQASVCGVRFRSAWSSRLTHRLRVPIAAGQKDNQRSVLRDRLLSLEYLLYEMAMAWLRPTPTHSGVSVRLKLQSKIQRRPGRAHATYCCDVALWSGQRAHRDKQEP
jgi:hypothetical protein